MYEESQGGGVRGEGREMEVRVCVERDGGEGVCEGR